MNLIEHYLFRAAATVFVLTLVVLTGVLWITQALREIDLLTAYGQTLGPFLYLTLLALPGLVMVIGPVALFIACLYVLNKLNADSEMVVINAAGTTRWQIAKPFVILGMIVTMLTAAISLFLMPESARLLRAYMTQIRADMLAHIVEEGRFTTVEQALTFHIRERRPDGILSNVLIFDGRDPEREMTYLAEEGHIVRDRDNAYLVMMEGSLHQRGAEPEDIAIVEYDRYVFDLSTLTAQTGSIHHHPREIATSELLRPHPDNFFYERSPGRFRTEFHDRFSSILYPLAFVFIALAALSQPSSNRQGRGKALGMAIAVMAGLRIFGFAATNMSTSHAWAVVPMYTTPLTGLLVGGWITFSNSGRRLLLKLDAVPLPRLGLRNLTAHPVLARLQAALGGAWKR